MRDFNLAKRYGKTKDAGAADEAVAITVAQTARPAAQMQYIPNNRWSAQAFFSNSRRMSFHYDNVQSGFFISYVKRLAAHAERRHRSGFRRVSTLILLRDTESGVCKFYRLRRCAFAPVVRLTLFTPEGPMKLCLVTAFPPSRRGPKEYGYHIARELQGDPLLSLTILAGHLEATPEELEDFSVLRCDLHQNRAAAPRWSPWM